MAWYNASWLYRVKVTVLAAKVDADLSNYPVYVDLSDLPADFHTNVKSDGGDIRVTESDGTTEIPREVVFYDSSTDTGELYFKASIDGDTDTDFYVYYGNSAASDYAVNDTYGTNNVWSSAYKGVWHLQAGVSGKVLDSSTNQNDGVLTNTSFGTGVINNGVVFDGSADVDFGDTESLRIINNQTIMLWVYPTNSSARRSIFSKALGGEFSILRETNGTLNYYYGTSGGNTPPYQFLNSNYSIPNDEWTHIVVTRDFTLGKLTFYINGSQSSQSSTTYEAASVSSLTAQLGRGYVYNFMGTLDEVRILGESLSSTWISTEYNNQSSPSTFYSIGNQETLTVITSPLPTHFNL